MDTVFSYFEQMNTWQIIIFGLIFLAVWFLPVIISLFFNPKHAKLIAIACVPAVLSVIVWSALIVWAFTGKVWSKQTRKAVNQN